MSYLTGGRHKGGVYTTRKTLGALGKLIFWYDYRVGAVENGSGRILSLRDQSPNGYAAFSTVSPVIDADGIGKDDGMGSVAMKSTAPTGFLKIFHDGRAWLLYTVLRNFTAVDQNRAVLRTDSLSGNSPTTCGVRIYASNSMICQIKNESNTQTMNGPSIPLDEWVLCRYIYYGDDSTDNLKMIAKTTIQSRTRTITPSSNNEEVDAKFLFNTRTSGNNPASDIGRQKLTLAYDVTGKTRSEIDALDLLIVATIKEDPEYSSLVT